MECATIVIQMHDTIHVHVIRQQKLHHYTMCISINNITLS